jgi:predicted metalloprotease
MDNENAAYCSADQQIYYATNMPDIVPPTLRTAPFVVDSIVAHEFGHAVQARAGIFTSEASVEQSDQSAGDRADADQMSRRTEQQADCFAGEFVHSVAQSVQLTGADETNIAALFYSIGDDQLSADPIAEGDHGTGADRQAWLVAGMTTPLLATCNTFTADPAAVR